MSDRTPFLYPGPRAALLRRVRAVTVDDLHALDAAVRELKAAKAHRFVDKGFFFAWWEGPRIGDDEGLELQDLFSAVLVALATGITGIDVATFGARLAPKPSGMEAVWRMFIPARPSRNLQDASIGLIDDALAPWDARLAVIAIWNMACSVALRDHLPDATHAALEAAWRRALGDVPA